MAKCPQCNKNWFWDWEQDTFKYVDGTSVKTISHHNIDGEKEENDEKELLIFQCECGNINSSMITDPNIGTFVLSIKEWKNINWEIDGHYWNNKCLNCKNMSCLNDETDYCQDINCSYNNVEG